MKGIDLAGEKERIQIKRRALKSRAGRRISHQGGGDHKDSGRLEERQR